MIEFDAQHAARVNDAEQFIDALAELLVERGEFLAVEAERQRELLIVRCVEGDCEGEMVLDHYRDGLPVFVCPECTRRLTR